jgi:hypothetical protein
VFLRRCYRVHNGQRHAYWALVESYRTARGPRQRVISYLGNLEEPLVRGVLVAAGGNDLAAQLPLPGVGTPMPAEAEWVEVDAKRVRIERSRAFGGAWVGLQVAERLGLPAFLRESVATRCEEVPWPLMALVLVLGRLCEPGSELSLAEQGYARTALPELLGVPAAKVNDDRLYRALDKLLPAKAALEQHLKRRLGELFGLEYDLLLYDVTSTYFEGQAARNPQAQRGHSRDSRPDCKQVCIALVVSREGMPLGYEVFAGNRADVKTVEEIVGLIEARSGVADRIWVMDRAMVSEKQAVTSIERRVGRLLEKYSRAARLLRVEVSAGENGRVAVAWTRHEVWNDWAQLADGCYLLRSNIPDWSAEALWKAYIQLTEAEAAFRIQKSDLALRPVWHQKQDRVQAHILVCFLGYVLWKTLGKMCQAAGLGDCPRKVFDTLSQLRTVDVVLPTRQGVELRRRCVERPDPHQAILLHRLGMHPPESLPMHEM